MAARETLSALLGSLQQGVPPGKCATIRKSNRGPGAWKRNPNTFGFLSSLPRESGLLDPKTFNKRPVVCK
jgi:hypothetical protein